MSAFSALRPREREHVPRHADIQTLIHRDVQCIEPTNPTREKDLTRPMASLGMSSFSRTTRSRVDTPRRRARRRRIGPCFLSFICFAISYLYQGRVVLLKRNKREKGAKQYRESYTKKRKRTHQSLEPNSIHVRGSPQRSASRQELRGILRDRQRHTMLRTHPKGLFT